jgi:hypothetical protein
MANATTDKRISDVVDLLKIADDPTRREAVEAIEKLLESVKQECLGELESNVEDLVEEGFGEMDLEDEIDNRVERWANEFDFGDIVEETLSNVDVTSYLEDDDLQDKVNKLGFVHEDDLVEKVENVLSKLKVPTQHDLVASREDVEQLMNRGLLGRLKWILTGK